MFFVINGFCWPAFLTLSVQRCNRIFTGLYRGLVRFRQTHVTTLFFAPQTFVPDLLRSFQFFNSVFFSLAVLLPLAPKISIFLETPLEDNLAPALFLQNF